MNFDLENTRRNLIAMREKFGANTPAGHRCSNLVEQLQNYASATGEQKAHLEKSISHQMADLAKLSSGAAKNAEDRGIATWKQRPKSPGPIHFLKSGNLFGEVPLDVPYAGCSNSDCIKGCNLGKGHCQRLENAFRAAGYGEPQ